VSDQSQPPLRIADDIRRLPLPSEELWVPAPARRRSWWGTAALAVALGVLLIAVALPLSARLSDNGDRSGVGGTAAPSGSGGSGVAGDAAAIAPCAGIAGNATLVAAFVSTAGAIADWTENRGYPDAPSATSPWRSLPANATGFVCYFDGTFFATRPAPPPGASEAPLPSRALLLVDSNGAVIPPAKFGDRSALPLIRPGGRF
jgi:hypothetical protein